MISYVDSSVDHCNHADMTEHEMYISTSDDQIRIELTEEKTDSGSSLAYLYVDHGLCHEAFEENPGGALTENYGICGMFYHLS